MMRPDVIGHVSHNAQQLHRGLLCTSKPVVFDVETTGLDVHSDRVLSYGFRVHVGEGWRTFILFTERCSHSTIQPHVAPDHVIQHALAALHRKQLILVGHNLKYDLLMLRREGVEYRGQTRDTLTLLRMVDQDRVFSTDTVGRRDLRATASRSWTNYKLKDVGASVLGIKPMYTPSTNINLVPYDRHAIYLAHDLYVTGRLHDYLWQGLSTSLRRNYSQVQSPLAEVLCDLCWWGVRADSNFAASELKKLRAFMAEASARHAHAHGLALSGLDDDGLRKVLFHDYRLPSTQTRVRKASLKADTLAALVPLATTPAISESLQLIIAYREAISLERRLKSYERAIARGNRIYSKCDNRQASGRISSSKPNLQQIANTKTLVAGDGLEITVRSRDIIIASHGYVLVAADVAQADVRVLAHEIDRCDETTDDHFHRLQALRDKRLPTAARYWEYRPAYQNGSWRGERAPRPIEFDPNATSPLFRMFSQTSGDFYSLVASAVTGRSITKSDPERRIWKTILLAQINGESPTGLTKKLKCNRAAAAALVDKFFSTFPDIAGWIALQQQQVALAGRTYTWGGRMRTSSAHHWMVSEKRVRLLCTYKCGIRRWRYWLDVSPIRPAQRYLTCFVHRIWSVADEGGPKTPKMIFDENRGRIGTKYYSHIDSPGFYILPFRNIAWSSIRRVQKLDRRNCPVEMVKYEGLDKTCRALVNNIMQGGTADLVNLMMLRSRAVCTQLNARFLINIHDELVYEVPHASLRPFIRGLRVTLSQPPDATWRVPIAMEFKVGRSFGSMVSLP